MNIEFEEVLGQKIVYLLIRETRRNPNGTLINVFLERSHFTNWLAHYEDIYPAQEQNDAVCDFNDNNAHTFKNGHTLRLIPYVTNNYAYDEL